MPKTQHINLYITRRCNMNCEFCAVTGWRNVYSELSAKEWKNHAEALNSLDIGYVNIVGGEPTLRNDLEDIIRIFSAADLTFGIVTNGVNLTKERCMKLIDSGVTSFSASVDTLPMFITGGEN